MDLKSILKKGKTFLAAGQSGEAYSVLKEAIDAEEEDYLLFCLFALAASNDGKIEEAVEMYEKAIQLDGKSVTAWQGLNKLYSTGKIKVDERALETVQLLLKESEESKKDSLMKDKRQYVLSLRKWNSLTKEDLETEKDSIPTILESIVSPDKNLSEDDKKTCSLCFSILGDDINGQVAIRKAIFMFKTECFSTWSVCVYDSRVEGDNEWIVDKRRMAMSIEYMMKGEIRQEWRKLIDQNTQDPVFQFLFAIDDGDMTAASEILESGNSEDISLMFASLRLLIRDEDYEVAIGRIRKLKSKFVDDSEVVQFLNGLEAESLLRSGKNEAALKLIPLPRPSFGLIEARIMLENGKEVEKTLLDTLSEVDNVRLDVRRLLLKGRKEEALDKCNELNEEEWEDVVLQAECSAPSKRMTLLVKAAKMNPRCSRAFFLLSITLRGKNRSKAISLADRAASIRRDNEEYAQLLDELMCENGEEDEKRLVAIQRYVNETSAVPEWARVSISRLLINVNRVTDALSYLKGGMGDDVSAIRWALLGEAYSLVGRLSSSISAYEESLQKEPNLHIVVSMLGVSLRLGDYSRTISLCMEWIERAISSSSLTPILIILCQSLLAICSEDISTHLPTLFIHINKLFSIAPPSSILHKLFGDSVILLSKTSDSLLSSIVTPPQWNITDALSCVRLSSHFYSLCVRMKREEGSYWCDLSLSLYLQWKMEGDKDILERSRKCLVHSIKLSGKKKKSTRSKLWCYLAMIEEARGEDSSIIRHCLSRSVQLDGRNGEVWLRLGVFYWKQGEIMAASDAIENSSKWDTEMGESWSVWAEISYSWNGGSEKGRREGEDMMRHAISLHPTVWAVSRYTQMVCHRLANERVNGEGEKRDEWNHARSLVDINRVLQLKHYRCSSSKGDRLRLAVLAELFGCTEEAKELHELQSTVHMERNELRRVCSPSCTVPSYDNLLPLHKLCNESTERLRELVEASECVIDPSQEEIVVLREEEGEGESKIEKKEKTVYPCLRGQSIPLLVSAIITFRMSMGDAFIRDLHELSPRDELIDWFPTVVPEEVDNGIRCIARDGEEPYRVHNEVAREILAILKERRRADN